ncbi:hypothetical protein AB0J14_04545 [Micromonospora arborensis]|uniref:hypothetical protein n=1 Tax=Micromonospora arborensis TaxID=2116518 RepID=UPI003401956B
MTAKVIQLDSRRVRPAPLTKPCAAGVTACGKVPARLYPCGWRREKCKPGAAEQPDTVAGSGDVA